MTWRKLLRISLGISSQRDPRSARKPRTISTSVVVNTSFNVRGEPIVCTPEDAYRCFMRTEMDLLALEDCLLSKEQQPAWEDDEAWREEYELD